MAVKLTSEQFARVQAHFAKFPPMVCPVCSGARWDSAGSHGAVPLLMTPEAATTVQGADILPVIAMVCTTCGHVREFAWKAVMGTVTPESYPRG